MHIGKVAKGTVAKPSDFALFWRNNPRESWSEIDCIKAALRHIVRVAKASEKSLKKFQQKKAYCIKQVSR